RWRFCCLTANRPGCDRLLPLRRIRTRHAHLMIDRRLSHEFFRCELGFLMLRTATRDRLGGPYRRCLLLLALGEKIALRLALLALRQARRLVAAVLPLLVALRIGRGGDGVAIPAADIATCRHDLASWWQGNSLNRAFVRSRWRMFLSYLKGFLAGHWSRRRQATIDTPEALARILIINPDLVGDTLTAIPLIRAVRQHLPAAQIDFLASPKGAEVLAGCPWLDRIHVYDLPNPNNHHGVVDRRARRATAELMRELRARTYDLAIDCSWWPERSLIHHAVRARYDIVRPNPEFLVWRALRPGDADGWIFDQILELLTPLGIRPEEPRLELWIGDDERASVARRLPPRAPGRIRVAVQTWAPFVPRRYPPRAFMSAIARHPLAERFDIVAFDPPNRLTGPLLRRAVATTGAWPLREAIVAMAECDLFVGNDGGMAHIAASCGLPGVVVFTSIRPEQWRPCGRLLPLHAAAALTCSGCGMRFCPTGDMTCQRLLDPAAITAAIDRSIGQR
ncbi:MAG: glycosyltransferase family 9 protein, partial [Planctomycetota bacterium]